MLQPEYTSRFQKDLKVVQKRRWNIELLKNIIRLLCSESSLPPKHCDHPLIGGWKGCRECHILPDWLLIYQVNEEMIVFERTGSHSDLF